jgi:hypothetical protein
MGDPSIDGSSIPNGWTPKDDNIHKNVVLRGSGGAGDMIKGKKAKFHSKLPNASVDESVQKSPPRDEGSLPKSTASAKDTQQKFFNPRTSLNTSLGSRKRSADANPDGADQPQFM